MKKETPRNPTCDPLGATNWLMSHKLMPLQIRFHQFSACFPKPLLLIVFTSWVIHAVPGLALDQAHRTPAVGVCHGWLFLTKTGFWLFHSVLHRETQTGYQYTTVISVLPPAPRQNRWNSCIPTWTWYSTKNECNLVASSRAVIRSYLNAPCTSSRILNTGVWLRSSW